jgi:glycosyltransferase involved in cell wall biosynthesis
LASHYQSAVIFVYPSLAEKGEAMGLAAVEAMANGCVPLVSNLDCFRDYIQDGTNGFVFDHRHGDPVQNLATRVTDLLRLSEANLARIAEVARDVTREFAVETVAEKYLDDFASLLGSDVSPQRHVIPSAARDLTSNPRRGSRDSSLRSE